jgi:hypothetical protein
VLVSAVEDGPLNSIGPNNFVSAPVVLYRGVDTLTQSVELSTDSLEAFLAEVDSLPLYQVVKLRGYTFSVGRVRGSFNRRLDFGGGFAILLPAPKLVARGVLQVHAGPEWLCARGEADTLGDLLAVVRDLVDGYAVASTVSRVDLCTDLLMDVEDWHRLYYSLVDGQRLGHLVHNGLQVAMRWDGDTPSSVTVGQGAAGMVRIYDKGLESAKGGDLESWLGQWDLARIVAGKVVVRIEYQLRGDFLHNVASDVLPLVGIRTLDDLYSVGSDLMRYLTAKWVRLAYSPRGHLHKRELLPAWSVLSNLLVDAWGSPVGTVKRVWRRGGAGTVDKLSRMLLGGARTLSARMGYVKGYDGPMALGTVLRHLERHESAGARWLAGARDRHAQLVYGAVSYAA